MDSFSQKYYDAVSITLPDSFDDRAEERIQIGDILGVTESSENRNIEIQRKEGDGHNARVYKGSIVETLSNIKQLSHETCAIKEYRDPSDAYSMAENYHTLRSLGLKVVSFMEVDTSLGIAVMELLNTENQTVISANERREEELPLKKIKIDVPTFSTTLIKVITDLEKVIASQKGIIYGSTLFFTTNNDHELVDYIWGDVDGLKGIPELKYNEYCASNTRDGILGFLMKYGEDEVIQELRDTCIKTFSIL